MTKSFTTNIFKIFWGDTSPQTAPIQPPPPPEPTGDGYCEFCPADGGYCCVCGGGPIIPRP